jgi:hypothetical protein
LRPRVQQLIGRLLGVDQASTNAGRHELRLGVLAPGAAGPVGWLDGGPGPGPRPAHSA